MSDQYIGEIRWFPYVRGAPSGFQLCDGSLLPIANYEALYTLIGTTYGGDGSSTFGVPDLRGRVAVHQGTGTGLTPRAIGQLEGQEQVTLTSPQMAQHTHAFQASVTLGTSPTATGNMPAQLPDGTLMYISDTTGLSPSTLLPQAFGITGGNQPHENNGPTLPIMACIATEGQFPARP